MNIKNYIVVHGDILSAICKKYYGYFNEELQNRIMKENRMTNPNSIKVGEILKLPCEWDDTINEDNKQVEAVKNNFAIGSFFLQLIFKNIPKILKFFYKQSNNSEIIPNGPPIPDVVFEEIRPTDNNAVAKEGFPILVDNKQYPADDPDTKKIRIILKEKKLDFGSDPATTCLQCTEYVSYRLLRDQIAIDWSNRKGRERHGKDWPEILKDTYEVNEMPARGVAISFPATEKNKFGHIAYIEEVSTDGFIVISDANSDSRGLYRNRKRENEKDLKNKNVKFVHFQKKY